MTFNPYRPDTLGCEWFPTVESDQFLNSAAVAGAVGFTATADETIDSVRLFVGKLGNLLGSGWEVEVYDRAALGVATTSVTAFVPTYTDANHQRGAFYYNAVTNPTGVAPVDGNVSDGLNNYPDPLYIGKGIWPNTGGEVFNDRYLFSLLGMGYSALFKFGGISGVATGKRISRVTVAAYTGLFWGYQLIAPCAVTPFVVVGGVRRDGAKQTNDSMEPMLVTHDWPANPVTGCSWTSDEVDGFDDPGDPSTYAGWIVDATNNGNNLSVIYQGWLEVETTDDVTDPRLAVGCLHPTRIGWADVPLASPVDGSPWAKTNGTEYLIVARRRSGEGMIGWRYLDRPAGYAGSMRGRDVRFASDSLILADVSSVEQDRQYALILMDGSTSSVDSQPYASVDGDLETSLGIDDQWCTVDVDTTVAQAFTTVGADTYSWVRALVRVQAGDTVAPLIVEVTTAGGTPIGSALTVWPDDLVDPKTGWQVVEGDLGAVALSAATSYRIRFTSNATPGSGWQVQTLSPYLAGGLAQPPADVADVTAGGATDFAVIDGITHTELDLAATVATQPDPPAGFTAVAVDPVPCYQNVTLEWDPTSVVDGGGFGQYEIERSDTRDPVWRRIREISSESVTTTEVTELRRNVATTFRIRVRRADQSASDWTTATPVTAAMTCCGYVLSSDVLPDLALWADDVSDGERTTTQVNTSTLVQLSGRPYQFAVHDLDYRGVTFTRTLILAALGAQGGTPELTEPGDRTFADLIAWIPSRGGTVPYVAVADQNGDLWLCSVDVSTRRVVAVGGAHMAEVTFVEVTDTPEPIDVEGAS